MRLSHRDLTVLQRALLELYAYRDLASFARAVPDADAALDARGRSNTGRDRLFMSLLRPHFEQARRNAELATARDGRALEACGLTPREAEVAHWLGRGKTNHEIARILSSSVRTVEKHVERILGKLEVGNRTEAAILISTARSAP